MILVVDAGNSRLKWGRVSDRRLQQPASVPHGPADLDLDVLWGGLERPERVLAVSVSAPAVVERIGQWTRERWGVDPQSLQTPAVGGGIACAYPEPAGLGVDRWAALVGARRHGLLPAVVVDCGTAATFDLLTPGSGGGPDRHQGGFIVPGLATMRRSLSDRAHHLPEVTGEAVQVPALNTPDAIRSGTLLGLAGLVEHLAVCLEDVAGAPCTRVITGGDAPALLPHLPSGYRHYPDLVLEGLAAVAGSEG